MDAKYQNIVSMNLSVQWEVHLLHMEFARFILNSEESLSKLYLVY